MNNQINISARAAIVALVAGVMLSGCVSSSPLSTRLDSFGVTVVTLDDPIVLARPVPQLAAAARDYAYLGPVEMNRMGDRDYYLWVGLASTIDRKLIDVAPADVQTLTLLLGGLPMTLPLADWAGGTDILPYEIGAPLYATFAARISLDQIQRIANADSVQVHFVSTSGDSRRYRLWQGEWTSWTWLAAAE